MCRGTVASIMVRNMRSITDMAFVFASVFHWGSSPVVTSTTRPRPRPRAVPRRGVSGRGRSAVGVTRPAGKALRQDERPAQLEALRVAAKKARRGPAIDVGQPRAAQSPARRQKGYRFQYVRLSRSVRPGKHQRPRIAFEPFPRIAAEVREQQPDHRGNRLTRRRHRLNRRAVLAHIRHGATVTRQPNRHRRMLRDRPSHTRIGIST